MALSLFGTSTNERIRKDRVYDGLIPPAKDDETFLQIYHGYAFRSPLVPRLIILPTLVFAVQAVRAKEVTFMLGCAVEQCIQEASVLAMEILSI